jgi:hypothetical protein
MKTRFFILMLLAGSSLFARTRVSIGIGVGGYGPAYGPAYVDAYDYGYYPPPPPPPVAYYAPPPYPGPGYTWIGGYYYPVGPRYSWRAGYWARPPYRGSRWVAPRYSGRHYYSGYWRR